MLIIILSVVLTQKKQRLVLRGLMSLANVTTISTVSKLVAFLSSSFH